MSRRVLGGALAAGIMAMGLGLPSSAHADEAYRNGSARKLGRGLANVVSAPLELLRETSLVSQKDGGLAGMTIGVVRGVMSTVIREGAGIAEVLTFYMPAPVADFQPLVKPEFVFVNGNWAE